MVKRMFLIPVYEMLEKHPINDYLLKASSDYIS